MRDSFSTEESLPSLLSEIPRYPTAEKATRLWRFPAQFEAREAARRRKAFG